MTKNIRLFLRVFVLLLALSLAGLAAAQHEGRGGRAPTADQDAPGKLEREEMGCRRAARLLAELEQDFQGLLEVSDPAQLQEGLARHKLKLAELRAVTGICSDRCGMPPKRKGCGHRASH